MTANAEVLTLLTGPRWVDRAARPGSARRGARPDRAELREDEDLDRRRAPTRGRGRRPDRGPLTERRARGPGDLPYSEEALERFALLADELRLLRTHAGEPILDVVRRIVDTTGIDVELASAVSPPQLPGGTTSTCSSRRSRSSRRSTATSPWRRCWPTSTPRTTWATGSTRRRRRRPTRSKLLTVHRAKGLEWSSVFLVGVCAETFPSHRSRTQWTTSPGCCRRRCAATPPIAAAEWLRQAGDRRADGGCAKAHQEIEELRLGYVAFTRATHELSVSSYLWSPTDRRRWRPRRTCLAVLTRWPAGGRSRTPGRLAGERDPQPLAGEPSLDTVAVAGRAPRSTAPPRRRRAGA